MKDIDRKTYDKLVYYVILFVMIIIPSYNFIAMYLEKIGFIFDSFNYNNPIILWVSFPILLILYIYGIKKFKFKINYFDIMIYILIILGIISTIFAIDVVTSIVGKTIRSEGLITLISYYFLFLSTKNLSNEKYKENLIKCFFILGVIQVGHGILEVYTNIPLIGRFFHPYMARAFCINPNFFGSYLVMLSSISSTLYLLKKDNKYLIFTIIYIIGLCLAQSTGPIIGFTLAYLFLIIIYHHKYKLKYLLILTLTILAVYNITDYTSVFIQKNIFHNEILTIHNVKEELSSYKDINSIEQIGTKRIIIWKKSLKLVKDYWLTGCGIDNFGYIYPSGPEGSFNKAHNIYLQMLLTNGVFATLTYMGLCFMVFLKCFKLKKPLNIALAIAFVGYCIQAFANISLINVATYFYIILGFLANENTN